MKILKMFCFIVGIYRVHEMNCEKKTHDGKRINA